MGCPLRLFNPRSLARAPARPVAQASQLGIHGCQINSRLLFEIISKDPILER
jgi:hypothetical protein